MSKQPPPVPTANAIGLNPTIIQIVGRPSTGRFPRTIAPPDHRDIQVFEYNAESTMNVRLSHYHGQYMTCMGFPITATTILASNMALPWAIHDMHGISNNCYYHTGQYHACDTNTIPPTSDVTVKTAAEGCAGPRVVHSLEN